MNLLLLVWLASGVASMVMWLNYRMHNPKPPEPTTIPLLALYMMAFGSFVLVTLLGPIAFYSVCVAIDREDKKRTLARSVTKALGGDP